MGITTQGLNVIAANVAGSSVPSHIAIGTSGLAFASGQTTLGSEVDRNAINTRDLATSEEVTLISNWAPLEISGTILREFGVMTLGSVMVNREVLAGSLVFDGEQELQIQSTIKFFISG